MSLESEAGASDTSSILLLILIRRGAYLINNKEHLTLEGIKFFIDIKASLNLDLS